MWLSGVVAPNVSVVRRGEVTEAGRLTLTIAETSMNPNMYAWADVVDVSLAVSNPDFAVG